MSFIDDFIEKEQLLVEDGSVVLASGALDVLEKDGYTPETFFDYLTHQHDCLLHGSREYFTDKYIKPNIKDGILYATDAGSIAILKAIISNKWLSPPGLQYPHFISEKEPLEVRIHGIQKDTVGEKGLVYIIPKRDGFINDPCGSWQFKSDSKKRFSAIIQVKREDFAYPIFDVDNGVLMPDN